MQLIGLMMIRDEQDMLNEALQNHRRFCDAIFVLDGTQGSGQTLSEEICRSFSQVQGYWKDEDTGYKAPLRDGARQFLLEQARVRYGINNWYIILHGDEIWGQDPRPYLEIKAPNLNGIIVNLHHFFPHISERASWDFKENSPSIEALSQWYMLPPIDENRLFWDAGDCDYMIEQHSLTIPADIRVWKSNIVVKQYNYRSPQQAHERAVGRRDAHWQENHYQHLINSPENFFVATLANNNYKWASIAPVGEGDATNLTANPLPTL